MVDINSKQSLQSSTGCSLDPRHGRTTKRGGDLEQGGGIPEQHHSSLPPHHLGQGGVCSSVAQLPQPLPLLPPPALPQPQPPLPELVLRLLLLIVPAIDPVSSLSSSSHSLLEVADDDGKWKGHGEGATDGTECSHKLS